MGALVPMLLVFMVFYFFLIRPQGKRQKEHQAMLARLKKGDSVVTAGGLVGSIHSVSPAELVIEIADKTRVKVIRGQVVGLYQSAEAPQDKENS